MSKNKLKKMSREELSEFQKLEEERAPNHWAYSDDPLLNQEPVFSDEVRPSGEVQMPTPQVAEEVTNKVVKPKPVPRNSGGALGSIINSARKKSVDIQNEVLENDPVIAKLAKIEQLMRTGAAGLDEDLYTDTSKSDGRETYAKRAEEFNRQNLKNLPNESELERKLRLQADAQRKRDLLRGIEVALDEEIEPVYAKMTPLVSQKPIQERANAFLAQRRTTMSPLDNLENEVKGKIEEIKLIKQQKIEKEAIANTMELETKEFADELEREGFLKNKLASMDQIIEKLNSKIRIKQNSSSNKKPKHNKKS